MAIFEGSRYENSDVIQIIGSDGYLRQIIDVESGSERTSFEFTYYTVKDGDRVDQIALNFFGDPELWWLIAEYNPHWMFYEELPAGLVLRIPQGLSDAPL